MPSFVSAAARAARLDRRRRLFLRSLAFACFALITWSVALALGPLGLLDERSFYGIVVAILSSWPVFLFAPSPRGSFRDAIRAIDDHALAETALFGRSGPAAPLVKAAAERRFAAKRPDELDFAPFRWRDFPKSLRRAIGAAGLLFFVSQAVVILLTHSVSFGFTRSSAVAAAATPGGREDLRFGETPGTERELLDEDGQTPPGAAPRAETGGRNERRADEDDEALDLPSGGNSAKTGGPSGDAGGDDEAKAAGRERDEDERAGFSPSDGEEKPDDARVGKKGEGSGAESRNAGYEGAGSGLVADPMRDYRSYLDKIAVERGLMKEAAGEGTAWRDPEAFVARLYSSYAANVAIDAVDDATLESLRSAWRAIKERYR